TDSNDYYPFGMSFVRNSEEDAHFGTGSYFNYKYNGKELQETGMYDYGARFYMPDIGRWGVVDNYSELGHDRTHYGYVSNNPIKFIDPDGNWEHNFEMDENGRVTKMENTHDNFDRLYKKGSFNEDGTLKSGLKEYRDYVQVNKTAPDSGTIISELSKNKADQYNYQNNTGELRFATTTNRRDALDVFQFAALNSTNEWSIQSNNMNRRIEYTLGTELDPNFSPNYLAFGSLGYSLKTLRWDMHSHGIIKYGTDGPSAGDKSHKLSDAVRRFLFRSQGSHRGTVYPYGKSEDLDKLLNQKANKFNSMSNPA